MIVLGVTGSIGMGKSTVCKIFRQFDIPVFDVDNFVHSLLDEKNEIKDSIKNKYNGIFKENGLIDRKNLGEIVFNNKTELKWLENLIHPFVKKEMKLFILNMRKKGKRIVILDIPLLFETKSEILCDKVLVVSSCLWIQKRRVLSRSGMTAFRFYNILHNQMPIIKKKMRSDYCIENNGNIILLKNAVKNILIDLKKKELGK